MSTEQVVPASGAPHVTPSQPALARRARRALLAVFAVNGAVLASWATRIPAVKESAGLSAAGLGLVLLAPAIGALVAFELSGRACAAFGSARTTGACAALFTVLLPLIALAAHRPALLFGALLLFGAGNGALDVAMNTHGVVVEQQLQRPVLSGLHAGWAAGGLLGAATGGAAAAAGLGVGRHFVLVTVLALAGAVLVGRRLPLHPPASRTEDVPDGSTAADGPAVEVRTAVGGAAPPGRSGLWRVLPGPVLLLGAVGFAGLLAEGAAADWSATYLRESAGSSAGQAAAGYAGFSAAMLISRLFGDALRARVPAVRLLSVSAALAAAGLLAGVVIGGTAAGVVGFTLLGAGLAVIIPIVFAAAGQLPEDRTGLPAATSLARVNTLSYVGFLAGPPLVGLLAHGVGLRAALLVPALLAAAVVPLARRALRAAPQAADPAARP